MERWWCLDCRTSVELNSHARCEICDSEALDTMERSNMYHTPTPSVFVPVPDVYAERVTVHLGSIQLESGDNSLTIDEAVFVN
jgi:hypothetical protein